jgi:hypothetical protein
MRAKGPSVGSNEKGSIDPTRFVEYETKRGDGMAEEEKKRVDPVSAP